MNRFGFSILLVLCLFKSFKCDEPDALSTKEEDDAVFESMNDRYNKYIPATSFLHMPTETGDPIAEFVSQDIEPEDLVFGKRTFYIDGKDGNDVLGDGTYAHPWKTTEPLAHITCPPGNAPVFVLFATSPGDIYATKFHVNQKCDNMYFVGRGLNPAQSSPYDPMIARVTAADYLSENDSMALTGKHATFLNLRFVGAPGPAVQTGLNAETLVIERCDFENIMNQKYASEWLAPNEYETYSWGAVRATDDNIHLKHARFMDLRFQNSYGNSIKIMNNGSAIVQMKNIRIVDVIGIGQGEISYVARNGFGKLFADDVLIYNTKNRDPWNQQFAINLRFEGYRTKFLGRLRRTAHFAEAFIPDINQFMVVKPVCAECKIDVKISVFATKNSYVPMLLFDGPGNSGETRNNSIRYTIEDFFVLATAAQTVRFWNPDTKHGTKMKCEVRRGQIEFTTSQPQIGVWPFGNYTYFRAEIEDVNVIGNNLMSILSAGPQFYSDGTSTVKVQRTVSSDKPNTNWMVNDYRNGKNWILDWGGGALGSEGHNVFYRKDSQQHPVPVLVTEYMNLTAKHNHFEDGLFTPRAVVAAGDEYTTAVTDPELDYDPRCDPNYNYHAFLDPGTELRALLDEYDLHPQMDVLYCPTQTQASGKGIEYKIKIDQQPCEVSVRTSSVSSTVALILSIVALVVAAVVVVLVIVMWSSKPSGYVKQDNEYMHNHYM